MLIFSLKNRIALILALACLLVLPHGTAWAGESLVNSEVDVDVTGTDAADAREQAMAKGQMNALMDLLGNLATAEQTKEIVNSLDSHKIAAMTRGTEVLEEKISSNRYRARLKVSFDADEISRLLGNNGAVAGQEDLTTIGSFLIIPSYEEDGNTTLWEDNNPWRNAWRNVGVELAAGDIVVPFGDNNDASIVDTKTIAAANYATLLPMTVRYGVTDILILQAKLTHTPDMVLEVVKRRISRTQNSVNLLTYRADPQETKDTLLARAAHDIGDTLERKKSEETESAKAVRGGDRNTIMLLASITTLSSWTELRAKLTKLPMIDKLDMLAISPHQVDVVVHYRGSQDSLANAITAQNIRLVKNPKYWVVSRD